MAATAQSERQRRSIVDRPDDEPSDTEDDGRRSSRGTLDPRVVTDGVPTSNKDQNVVDNADGQNMKSKDTKLEDSGVVIDGKGDHRDDEEENDEGDSLLGDPGPNNEGKQQPGVADEDHPGMSGDSLQTVKAEVYSSPGHVKKDSDPQPCHSNGAAELPSDSNIPVDLPESSTNPLNNAVSVDIRKDGSEVGESGQELAKHRKMRNHLEPERRKANGEHLHVGDKNGDRPRSGKTEGEPTHPTRTGLRSNTPKGKSSGKQPTGTQLEPVEEGEETPIPDSDLPTSLHSDPNANQSHKGRPGRSDPSEHLPQDASRFDTRKRGHKGSFALSIQNFLPAKWRKKMQAEGLHLEQSEPLMNSKQGNYCTC